MKKPLGDCALVYICRRPAIGGGAMPATRRKEPAAHVAVKFQQVVHSI